MGIRVKTIVADHDLTFVGNMGGRSGYEFQIIHPLHFSNVEYYVEDIRKEFKDLKIWESNRLEKEPFGLNGLRNLAREVYGDINSPDVILNPKNWNNTKKI